MSPTPGSLLGLPSELQEQIVLCLIASPCLQSIHSLLLTCKYLYNIVLPISVRTYSNATRLYRPWSAGRYHHDSSGQGAQPRNRTLRFLRYILLVKPKLAKHVQTLDLQTQWSSERDENNEALRINPEELSLYQTILQNLPYHRLDPQFISQWITALDKGVEDALIALLLVICPNIQTLVYQEPRRPSFFSRFLVHVIKDIRSDRAGPMVNFLKKLQNVRQMSDGNAITLNREEIGSWLFLMPKVRIYEGCHFSIGDYSCEGIDQIPRRSSLIESLTILDSWCTSSAFHSMINACHFLREFRYGHRSYGSGWPQQIVPRDIITALLQHASSLESLQITYCRGEYEWQDFASSPEPSQTYMGAQLRQMYKLKHLTLVPEALTGICNNEALYPIDVFRTPAAPPFSECIPEQLEYFEIQGCQRKDLDRLSEFVETLRNENRFPQLRKVKFTFDFNDRTREEVERLCLHTRQLTVTAW